MPLLSRLRDERGLTLSETVGALLISGILSAATVTVLTLAVTNVGQRQLSIGQDIQTANTLDAFTASARQAVSVRAVSTHTFVFHALLPTACERHTYSFIPDPNIEGRTALEHSVVSYSLTQGQSCADVSRKLSAGTDTAQADRIEIANLDPSSRFYYYDLAGSQTYVPGDTMYSPTTTIPLCQMAAVDLEVNEVRVLNRHEVTQVNRQRAALIHNVEGVTC